MTVETQARLEDNPGRHEMSEIPVHKPAPKRKREDRSQHHPPGSGSSLLGKLIGLVLVLIGVGIVAAILSMPTPVQPTPPVEAVPVNVTVQPVTPIPHVADTFSLTGVVQPRAIVQVSAEVPGRIEAYGTRATEARRPGKVFEAGTPIREGQSISRGDPLVILNRELLQARYDRAAAQHEHDAHEYDRVLDLFRRGTASANELRLAQRTRDVSKAELDEAAHSLERSTIVAPISGVLNDWRMELGEYATSGSPVAEIVDLDTVKVQVDVPERDVGFLRYGQVVEVIPLDNESSPVTGKITYINALADKATRTTRIEVTVENLVTDPAHDGAETDEYRLRSGQIVNVRLERRTLTDVVMVPLASVIPLEHGREVYVVVDGKAERRPVELGFIRGRDIRVTAGLTPGEQLIVSGHRLVSPGQPVNVIPDQPRESSR